MKRLLVMIGGVLGVAVVVFLLSRLPGEKAEPVAVQPSTDSSTAQAVQEAEVKETLENEKTPAVADSVSEELYKEEFAAVEKRIRDGKVAADDEQIAAVAEQLEELIRKGGHRVKIRALRQLVHVYLYVGNRAESPSSSPPTRIRRSRSSVSQAATRSSSPT